MHQVEYFNNSVHTVFVCFVFVWEQNSDLCHLHKKLIGFYNRDEKCLQRGTHWV
jgi:penicillin-binding protein-related factor A (putative recombinase)